MLLKKFPFVSSELYIVLEEQRRAKESMKDFPLCASLIKN